MTAGTIIEPRKFPQEYEAILRLGREGPAPLLPVLPGTSERERLHVAVVIPPFARGSGGHGTIFQILRGLEGMGHSCSVWLVDPYRQQGSDWPAVVRHKICEYFGEMQAPVFTDFGQWYGADVVMATGWQTVYPSLLLDRCLARTYMVNDYEEFFYPRSAESHWAAATYNQGLYCIAASPWLRDFLVERHGVSACDFQLGVDHAIYFPRSVERRDDTVVFYSRASTPRRAVDLAMLAFEELLRRRPNTRLLFYGDRVPIATTFGYENAGVVTPDQLAWLYSESTVGLSLSMTNFSLVPKEMLACGLPCVELAGVSAESIFGADGPLELTSPTPIAIAGALERLLDDQNLWKQRSGAGIEFVASHTWDVAVRQVEAGIREALRINENR